MPEHNPHVVIVALYNGKCAECKDSLYEGDRIVYNSATREVYCMDCANDLDLLD